MSLKQTTQSINHLNNSLMESTAKLHVFDFSQSRTYMIAALFVAGNIILPQLCHFMPQGGLVWLPIYFFTLLAAYKYGWKVGVLTALASPLANSMLFGMPAAAMLPAIMLKSGLLAVFAAFAANRAGKASLAAVAAAVIGYQALGAIGEWALTGSFVAAMQDFRIGIPGILAQIFGGWAVIKYILK